jgi:hypothetical protein
MVLNVSLDVLFYKMKGWKGIREKAREINSTKACAIDDESFRRILNWLYGSSIQ